MDNFCNSQTISQEYIELPEHNMHPNFPKKYRNSRTVDDTVNTYYEVCKGITLNRIENG